jgi:hypothetical protein
LLRRARDIRRRRAILILGARRRRRRAVLLRVCEADHAVGTVGVARARQRSARLRRPGARHAVLVSARDVGAGRGLGHARVVLRAGLVAARHVGASGSDPGKWNGKRQSDETRTHDGAGCRHRALLSGQRSLQPTCQRHKLAVFQHRSSKNPASD